MIGLSAEDALAKTITLYDRLANRRGDVQKADDYFRGKQPLRFASEKWREYHAARYERFCDNWCQPVASSSNERLRADGFRLSDEPGEAEKGLWKDWQASDMEAQSSQGWLHSIIARRSYVLVWGDRDGEPVSTWERADQVIVDVDPERPAVREAALKTWHDGSTEYATLYTADEVWKWQRPVEPQRSYSDSRPEVPQGSRGDGFFNGANRSPSGLYVVGGDDGFGQWEPRQAAGDDTWPLRNPLGVVPVVEMPNRPMLGSEPLSDIHGTMAMQDAINLLWAYLFNAADHASFPARVVMGQEPPKLPILDENGLKVGERVVDLKKLAEDRIMWLTGENAKIGQWDAAKLDVFTTVIETAVTHVAAQTRTPPHYLVLGKGMVNVNAEGMKAAETGLVKKVEEMQLFLGPGVREVFRLMALVRGNEEIAKKCRYGVVQWRDAENHSEAQMVDALVKLQAIGFPFAWLAERYGLSQTEVARVEAMRERDRAADPLGQLSGMLGRANPGGQVPPAPTGAPSGNPVNG